MYLKIFGLPAHPLVVHATVVLVAAAALWPALRRTHLQGADLLPLRGGRRLDVTHGFVQLPDASLLARRPPMPAPAVGTARAQSGG